MAPTMTTTHKFPPQAELCQQLAQQLDYNEAVEQLHILSLERQLRARELRPRRYDDPGKGGRRRIAETGLR